MINGTDLYGAMAELIRLKDIKDIKDKMDLGTATVQEHQDYDANKMPAWRRARAEMHASQNTIIARVKPGEPLFILRAQDQLAIGQVFQWEFKARAVGTPQKKLEGALAIARAMGEWPQRKRPD